MATQTPSTLETSAADVGPTPENLAYLKEGRVCERLEEMVRHVLLARPEDPVLAMCNYLNDANRAGGAGRRLRDSQLGGARAAPAPLAAASHGRAAAHSAGSAAEHRSGVPAAAPVGGAAASRGQSTAATAAAAAPVATHSAAGSPTTSMRVSNTFPTSADSRRGSAVGGGSRGGSALQRLERDDSARSDVSAFSVTSVDMAEFLADFRAAHYSIFGSHQSDLTMDDLADVVDRVALPIPDTRLLSDLFLEMDAAVGTGRVPFGAFLARMSFRIAGKYHTDVVRGIFFVLARATLSGSEAAALEERLDDIDGLNALVEEDAAARSAAASSAQSPSVGITSPSLHKGSSNEAAITGATPLAATGGNLASTTIRVTLTRLCDATLRGVGLRVSPHSAEETLMRVGLVVVDEEGGAACDMHLLDLARFLSLATTTGSGVTASTPTCSIHQVPSVSADLNELAMAQD